MRTIAKNKREIVNSLVQNDLKKILHPRQKKLLRLYLDGATLGEIMRKLNLHKEDVFLEFIYLGQKLCIFKLLSWDVSFPINLTKEEFLGYTAAVNEIKKVVKYESVKNRAARKKS